MYKKFENSFKNPYNKKTNQFILKDKNMLGEREIWEEGGFRRRCKKEQEHPS